MAGKLADNRNIVTVYLIADSARAQQRLLGMVEGIPDARIVGVTDQAATAAPILARTKPDLLLLDATPEQTEQLGNYLTLHAGVLACTSPAADNGVPPLLANGALPHQALPGSILKPGSRRQVLAAIRKLQESRRPYATGRKLTWQAINGALPFMVGANARGEPMLPPVLQASERRKRRSERRRSELHRLDAAARLESMMEQLPGIPYLAQLDGHGSLLYISPKIESLLGYSSAEWCEDSGLRLRRVHPEDRALLQAGIDGAITNREGYTVEYRIFGKDGAMHWLRDEARVVSDHDAMGTVLQGVVLDITERKQTQEDLQRSHAKLQQLIAGLDMLRVEEQRRLAHEMHDDFGQLLAAMKMDLSTLRQQLPPDNSHLVKCLGNISELVDTMVGSVRRILADLPPKMLDDLGLFDALESMLGNFEKRHHIACRLTLPSQEPALPVKMRTALYRMVQETLNNVAKHARATRVEASFRCSTDWIVISVRDNGVGMAEDALSKRDSFGLLGIRERAAAWGGKMIIASSAAGTGIEIFIPAPAAGGDGPDR